MNYFIPFIGILLLASPEDQLKSHRYFILCSPVEYFIAKDKSGNILEQYDKRVTKSSFLLDCISPEEVILSLENYSCDSIFISIYDYSKRTHTKILSINAGDEILLRDYLKETEITSTSFSAKASLQAFLEYVNKNNKNACGRYTGSMGKKEPESSIAEEQVLKLFYEEDDYAYYYGLDHLLINFQHFSKYPIKNISLISHLDSKTVLYAGDTTGIKQHKLLPNTKIANINQIIENRVLNVKDTMAFRLTGAKIEDYLSEPIKCGQWYQLRIELNRDSTEDNSYLFNFQLISDQYKSPR